ncbi:MAG TPA: TMEM175 family protein [Microbacteriaceae bacterium]|jgi:uncharacterized membrane protein|nr:TMEM175 family protein [Microbacteriaceae bacterium]
MAKTLVPAVKRETTEFDRGLGFFDAVYAFAITLLITNVDMPAPDAWKNIGSLLGGGLGNQLLGFIISFVVIAVFWKVNFDLLREFNGMNTRVVIANLVTVGLVVLLPFTTQGISDPQIVELPLPTALYACNIALAILSQMVMYEVGRRSGLIAVDHAPAALWAGRIDALLKVAVFAVSIPVSFLVGPDWARWVWATLLVIAPLSGRWSDRRIRESGEVVGQKDAAGSVT